MVKAPYTGGGVILFRGDDRGGLDPYVMDVRRDGRIRFKVQSRNGVAEVAAPISVDQFVHVAGTLDDVTGVMQLYINGVSMSRTRTAVRPFGGLDANSNPGVGIGNHGGYPLTPHNYPFHGLIDELRLYDSALTAEQVLAHFNAQRGVQ